jgi:hypothetical protein
LLALWRQLCEDPAARAALQRQQQAWYASAFGYSGALVPLLRGLL